VADLADVGRLAGVGYQLVDDLRGVFSDEAVTGKSALGDLREGKVTPLIAHARQTPFWPQIAAYVGDAELDESRAAAARALLDRSGSRAFVEELAERHLRAAVRSAEELGLHPSLTAELSRLTDLVLRSCAA
jgi:geranylgeranyl diphosphate synthase type II